MFGKNPIEKKEHGDGATLQIVKGSPFRTIQGEGPFTGWPAIFVRLHGCNLACTFCFIGNTQIAMAKGPRKKIKDIKLGDQVIAYNEKIGKFEFAKVSKLYRSKTDKILCIRTGHGHLEHNPNEKIYCTPEHPFYVRGKGWVPANKLKHNDVLLHLSTSEQMKLRNPQFDPAVKEHLTKQSRTLERRLLSSKYMTKTMRNPKFVAALRKRMIKNNPMKDPAVALKGFLSRQDRGRKTGTEKRFELITAGMPIKFVGDGALTIAHRIPDFLVTGQKKVIEVWHPDAQFAWQRDKRWKNKRANLFAKHGYQTLFVPLRDNGKKNGHHAAVRKQVAEFIHNGETITNISKIEKGSKAWVRLTGTAKASCMVYNFEVEKHHTYVANGKIVHNCDTSFSDADDPYINVEQLIEDVSKLYGSELTRLVVITGGEPLRQNIVPFCLRLKAYHPQVKIQIETAGTLWVNLVETLSTIICSPKTPIIHPQIYEHATAFKYVIDCQQELDQFIPVTATQANARPQRLALPRPGAPVYLSPMDTYDVKRNKENQKLVGHLALQYGCIAGIQLHKVLELD